MAMKSLGLAGIAIGCSMSIAVAQNAPLPTQQQKDLLKAITARHAGPPATLAPPSVIGHRNSVSPFPVGTFVVQPTNCGWTVNADGDQFFFMFLGTPFTGGAVLATNNLFATQALQISCEHIVQPLAIVVNDAAGNITFTQSFPVP